MAESIFTRALARANGLHGSTQSLASALRVPEQTLLRWMAGRAQMPLRAFHHVLDMLVTHETRSGADRAAAPAVYPVAFHIAELRAQCPQCEGFEFFAGAPAAELPMTAAVKCAGCERGTTHAEVLRELATRAVTQSRALLARRGAVPAGRATDAPERCVRIAGQ